MSAALGDVFIACVVGFLILAGLSLMTAKTSVTPPFARRAPTSGNPQLRQDSNALALLRPAVIVPQVLPAQPEAPASTGPGPRSQPLKWLC
jgi:hypothetical protein